MGCLAFEPFFATVAEDALKRVRAKAWDHFLELGLPAKGNEVFRKVKLKRLLEQKFCLADEGKGEKRDALVFVNGVFQKELSQMPEGIIVLPLDEAMGTYGSFLTKGLKEETDPFAALNAALHEKGLFVYVPPKMAAELKVVSFVEAEGAMVNPRLQLFAGQGAEVSLTWETEAKGEGFFLNQVIDCHLEEQARVSLFQKEGAIDEAFAFSAVRAHQKRSSHFLAVMETKGSKTVRHDYRVVLAGEGAEADLKGVWRLHEKREAHVNVLIDHQAPNCRSLQLFKGALGDFSRSSFEGKIVVRQAAQKTDAFQLNNNLLLSDHAHADSKPNLEVFADDVKASHGATVGQLDQEELFYLNTRGFSKEQAQALLIESYCREITDLLP